VNIEAFVGVIRVSNVLESHRPTGMIMLIVTSVIISAIAIPVCPRLLLSSRLKFMEDHVLLSYCPLRRQTIKPVIEAMITPATAMMGKIVLNE